MNVSRALRCGVVAAVPFLAWTCAKAGSTSGPPAVATQLAFQVDPVATQAGATIPSVVVQARDGSGKLVRDYQDSITVTLSVNPGNGTLLGTTTEPAVGGAATFTDLSIEASSTAYRLQASSGTLTPTLSTKFDIIPGPATHLGFTIQPATAIAGTPFTPPLQVAALDSLGNPATSFSGTVAVAISPGSGTNGAALSGIVTVPVVAGVATFSTLAIDKVGAGYVLTATAIGIPPAASGAFDVVAGSASQLVFIAQPTTTIAGSVIAPPVQVEVRDAVGNPLTAFAGNVTVSISSGTGTSGASLSGMKTVAVTGGIATFSDLGIKAAGTGYTLAARSTGLAGATSAPFDVLVGPLTALVFTSQPQTTTAGATLSPAVVVTAEDAAGNAIPTFTDPVTLSISANPGNGTLHGTKTRDAVNGEATFADLSIDSVGTGYRLQAASGAQSAISQAFSINPGGASRLVFEVQPGATEAGATISPAIQVAVLDSLGNTVTAFNGEVTLAITAGTGKGGANLAGTTTATARSGIASFSTLAIDSAATGYTLTATSAGFPDIVSARFSITPGSAARLEFTVQPRSTAAGATLSPPVKVTARDAIGNSATGFTGSVTLTITAGTGSAGANLAGTKTMTAVAGVATFSDLSIDQAGNGFTLSARSSGISGDVSTAFDILIGSFTQLVFTQQPTTDTAGRALTPPVQITAEDAAGNTVTGFTGGVTITIAVNPGAGTLAGTKTVNAVAGVAAFGNLSIDKAGTGYRLQAAAGGVKDTSQAFSILPGKAASLAFTQQPTASTAATAISPSVKVAALDGFGNTSTGYAGNVTVAIGTNAGGGFLAGTLTLGTVNGVATFSNLSIDKSGTGYTLKATAAGLTTATSAQFDVTPDAATQLVFTVQPVTTTAGATLPAIKMAALDGSGNAVPAYTGNVTMGFGTNAGGGTLAGTITVKAQAGVATFSDLSINRSGTGYTLKATAPGLTAAISQPFDVRAGQAARLVFTAQPQTTTATTTLAPVTVAVQDAAGNTVTSFSSGVTISIAVNPGGGALAGTKTVNAVAGVATFGTLSIDKVGTGYRLGVAEGVLTPDTSQAFSITAGSAKSLVFTVQPTTTTAPGTITPAVKVTALDAGGNVATGYVGTVTVAIVAGTGTAGATLGGTPAQAAGNGIATFSDLSITLAGTSYQLKATAAGLTAATSSPFDVN